MKKQIEVFDQPNDAVHPGRFDEACPGVDRRAAQMLNFISPAVSGTGCGPLQLRVVPDVSGNAVIVQAGQQAWRISDRLVNVLDQSESSAVNQVVIRVKNGYADSIAQIIGRARDRCPPEPAA
ncbi:MAG: hypothetical protein U0798_19550 [Gemmataceae bacterium]